MARLTASVVMVAVVLLVTTAATRAFAQTPLAESAGSKRLLDVPYLPQTEDLCGGAAMAMVLR